MKINQLRTLADSLRGQDRLVHADELVQAIDAISENVAEPQQPDSDAGRTIDDIADEGAKKAADETAKAAEAAETAAEKKAGEKTAAERKAAAEKKAAEKNEARR